MDYQTPPAHRVLLLVPEDGLLFEAVGLADIFNRANLSMEAGSPEPRYQVTLASTMTHRVVHGRSGLNLLADTSLADIPADSVWDTLVVTGGGSDPVQKGLIAGWIRDAAPRCRRIVSVCSGAFHLAAAGLLDGRRATTHWNAAAEFFRSFPLVEVDPDPIYVKDGPVWTSAGASSGFDLALALVEEDHGHALARAVAQYLVLYLRRPGGQSQFSRFLDAQAGEPGPIREVQAWALEHLTDDLRVETLADRAAMSPRNFIRVFTRETGTSPARFIEQIRLEAARQRLEQGRETLDEVAGSCGFGTALTLRRTFQRNLGIGPLDYRGRFGMI